MIRNLPELNENGTGTFTVQFRNQKTGDLITMESLEYTLIDKDENIINSNEEINVSSPGQEADIQLYGDDLKIQDTETEERKVYRWLIIKATYLNNSGQERPLTTSKQFIIRNLKYLS